VKLLEHVVFRIKVIFQLNRYCPWFSFNLKICW